jgi:hypothetical protein
MKCPTCEGEAGQFGIAIRMARMWCKHCGTTYIVDTNDSSVNSVYVPETWNENLALRAQVQDYAERAERVCGPLNGHYFAGGQWKCECEKHTRADFGVTETEPLPRAKFDGSTGLSSTVAGRKTEGSGV